MPLRIPDSVSDSLRERIEALCAAIRSFDSLLIAFSGGVDSTFLARVAHDELGENAVAVTARSKTYPQAEYAEAVRLAGEIGIRHISIETEELEIAEFKENPPDRCYYCKRELFGNLLKIAGELGLKHVADGANADDSHDFRPGSRAASELNVRSPLKDAGFTKQDIRDASRALGLDTWDKPAYACLSSRFPYGEPITARAVSNVGRAEDFLRNELGLRQLRVRHHGDIARIEVPAERIAELASDGVREKIVAHFKELGYAYVTLDLQGYRTGSMNEVLGEERQGGGSEA